jgi:hypothetical protein
MNAEVTVNSLLSDVIVAGVLSVVIHVENENSSIIEEGVADSVALVSIGVDIRYTGIVADQAFPASCIHR